MALSVRNLCELTQGIHWKCKVLLQRVEVKHGQTLVHYSNRCEGIQNLLEGEEVQKVCMCR